MLYIDFKHKGYKSVCLNRYLEVFSIVKYSVSTKNTKILTTMIVEIFFNTALRVTALKVHEMKSDTFGQNLMLEKYLFLTYNIFSQP